MKEEQRDYTMSDPLLTLKCEDVLDSIDRDITEFTARGFTPTKRTAFIAATDAFDALHSDNYYKGLQEIKTHDRDVVRTNSETLCNVVFTAVVNVWGLHSSQYKLFSEDKPMSQLSDPEYLRFLEDFADSTEDNLGDLAGEGIDTTTVDNIRAFRVSFNTAQKDQRKAIKNRAIGTGERIKVGNALYKLLVGYCNTGKNIWLNVDEPKHSDYVIYHNHGGIETIHLNLAPGQIVALATDLTPFSTDSYYAKKTGDAAGLIQLYYGPTDAIPYSGTGFALSDNNAHTIAPTDPGPIQPFLLAQNTSSVAAGLNFAVIL